MATAEVSLTVVPWGDTRSRCDGLLYFAFGLRLPMLNFSLSLRKVTLCVTFWSLAFKETKERNQDRFSESVKSFRLKED
jgi:hypothetical protein